MRLPCCTFCLIAHFVGLTRTRRRRVVLRLAAHPHSIAPPCASGERRPWETEADPEIRAQLRVLDMKRATFGERHAGTHTTLGRLGGLCRAAGRLQVGGWGKGKHVTQAEPWPEGGVEEGQGEEREERVKKTNRSLCRCCGGCD